MERGKPNRTDGLRTIPMTHLVRARV